MTQDPSRKDSGEDAGTQEGNPFGGSPLFPATSGARPTGDTGGFNGSFGETEHHTQHEYDAGHQHPESGDEPGGEDQQA